MSRGDIERDKGIARALAYESDAWKRSYERLFYKFLQKVDIGGEFTGEEIRQHAKEEGLCEPHTFQVWGGMAHSVLKRRLELRIIEETGRTTKAKDPTQHSHRYVVYRRLK